MSTTLRLAGDRNHGTEEIWSCDISCFIQGLLRLVCVGEWHIMDLFMRTNFFKTVKPKSKSLVQTFNIHINELFQITKFVYFYYLDVNVSYISLADTYTTGFSQDLPFAHLRKIA